MKTKLKFTNGIIAVSEWCKDYFVRKTNIDKIKVILNGISSGLVLSRSDGHFQQSALEGNLNKEARALSAVPLDRSGFHMASLLQSFLLYSHLLHLNLLDTSQLYFWDLLL